jgi:gas vesicle protein
MSKDNSGTLMVAFVIGALTGAAVALLFAPASGEETRELLGQKAREGRDKAREAVDQGRDYYRSQRDNLVTAVERGREAFQQARGERGDQV